MKRSHFFFSGILVHVSAAVLILISNTVIGADLPDRPFVWYDDDDYPPFIYKDKDGRPRGLYQELMVEIFKRMEVPLIYEVFPWKRAQKYTEEGKSDGMITALTRQRSALFVATDPLYVKSEYAFARNDNPRIDEILSIRSVEELRSFKLVDTIGSGWAEEYFAGMDITWTPTYGTALGLLAKGRADIFVLGRERMTDIRKRIRQGVPNSEALKKIITAPHPLAVIRFSLLIRKNSEYAGIIPRFNQALRQMKEDGSYQELFNKYFGADGQVLLE